MMDADCFADGLRGKWANGEGCEYGFDGGNWEYSRKDGVLPVARGTFVACRGMISLARTHVNGLVAGLPLMIDLGPTWHSRSALKAAMLVKGFSSGAADEALDDLFFPRTETYFVSGDVLFLTLFGETETWTRLRRVFSPAVGMSPDA